MQYFSIRRIRDVNARVACLPGSPEKDIVPYDAAGVIVGCQLLQTQGDAPLGI
jgi:hypothetical protein